MKKIFSLMLLCTAIVLGTTSCSKDDSEDDDSDVQEGTVYAVGDLFPDASNPVGVVFWLENPVDGKSEVGKIVSTDTGTEITWGEAQKWRSANALPSGMDWATPVNEDLQFLWCAFNGAAPASGWLGISAPCPPVNMEAQAAFNKIRVLNDGTNKGANRAFNFWTSQDNGPDYGFTVNFNLNGSTMAYEKINKYSVVNVATFGK